MSQNAEAPYPIGTPGRPWGAEEREAWRNAQTVKRSYADEVLSRLEGIDDRFLVESYGALAENPERYPLRLVRSRQFDPARPTVLVTGGVHGYETSGVQGAIRFVRDEAPGLADRFNFVVFPCVSPWGYETINRWNPGAVDPNRSFRTGAGSPEAEAVMETLDRLGIEFDAHFDLHETTDTDNSEFRPALAARDAVTHDNWDIPDGFYTVGDAARPEPDFQRAVIAAVEKVTHIAPGVDGAIIGEPLQQHGVINYDAGPLSLCMGMTSSRFVTTTEVYPDSPRATDEICIQAQIAAVRGGLEYMTSLG